VLNCVGEHPNKNEFVRNLSGILSPPPRPRAAPNPAAILRLRKSETQKAVVRGVRSYEKLRRDEAEVRVGPSAKPWATGLEEADHPPRRKPAFRRKWERHQRGEKIKELIKPPQRPPTVAGAIRDRCKRITDATKSRKAGCLIEADPMTMIPWTICQLPFCRTRSTRLP